jgi:hypothetical protein
MESQKNFAKGYASALEIAEFFKQRFEQTYPARAILVLKDTTDRIAPEEVVGEATVIVCADFMAVMFKPTDEKRSTFHIGEDAPIGDVSVEPVLLSMDSEDIVFRMPQLSDMRVRPGGSVHLLAKPDGM